jgi:hypothetical protein
MIGRSMYVCYFVIPESSRYAIIKPFEFDSVIEACGKIIASSIAYFRFPPSACAKKQQTSSQTSKADVAFNLEQSSIINESAIWEASRSTGGVCPEPAAWCGGRATSDGRPFASGSAARSLRSKYAAAKLGWECGVGQPIAGAKLYAAKHRSRRIHGGQPRVCGHDWGGHAWVSIPATIASNWSR